MGVLSPKLDLEVVLYSSLELAPFTGSPSMFSLLILISHIPEGTKSRMFYCEPSCAHFFLDFYKRCGPSCAHIFLRIFYAIGMLMQKHMNAIFLYFYIFMPPQQGVLAWGFKRLMQMQQTYFYDFLSAD